MEMERAFHRLAHEHRGTLAIVPYSHRGYLQWCTAPEIKRSGTSVFQTLQDFGIMDADAILQVMANHIGAEVVSLKNVELPKEALAAISANNAKMYRALPVALEGSTLRVAFEDPLDPARIDELGFVVKKDIQVVLANPTEIQAGLDKYYGEEGSEDVMAILKELGGDEKITEEAIVATETDDEELVAGLANEAPIRFVIWFCSRW
jgi:type IV pilus assembly protein PilB